MAKRPVAKPALNVPRPTQFTVGAYTYSVKYDDVAVDRFAAEKGGGTYGGYSDHDKNEVYVRQKGYSEDQVRTVLLHEIIHCLGAAGALWYTFAVAEDKRPEQSEEAVCQVLSPLLLQFLRDNVAVVNYVRSKEG